MFYEEDQSATKMTLTGLRIRWPWIAVGGYLLVFFLLRLLNIMSFPLETDEIRHIVRARETLEGDLFIGLREGWKQTYIWLIAIASPFFVNLIVTARIMAVLAGLINGWVCYRLAQALYPSRRLGYLAALFYLFIPFAVFYDRLALTDSLLTTLMGLSLLLSFRLWQQPSMKWAILLGLTFSLATLTKPYALLYYPAPLLTWLILGRKINYSKIIKMITVVYGTTLFAWLLILTAGRPAYTDDHSKKLVFNTGDVAFLETVRSNLSLAVQWLTAYLTVPFTGLLILAILFVLFKRDRIGFVLLVLIVTPVVAFSLVTSVWYARYLLPLLVPMSVLCAWGIDELVSWLWLTLNRTASQVANASGVYLSLQLGLFFIISLSALRFDYLIVIDPVQAPLPIPDKEAYPQSRFYLDGYKESATFAGELATRYPEMIFLKRADAMPFELESLNFYLPDSTIAQITTADIGEFDSLTSDYLDQLARQAPTFALLTTKAEDEQLLIYDGNAVQPFPYPQIWRLASFPQPNPRWDVEVYQWLLPHDFSIRWQQQGGDATPHIAWQPTEPPSTVPGGTLIAWPQMVTTPETLQQFLAATDTEYILVTSALIAAHPALFASFMATDGTHLTINHLPLDWRLSFAYPGLPCQWCLFQLRPPDVSASVRWTETVELVGYDLAPITGTELYVTLYWDVLHPVTGDYVVFVHLMDGSGQLVAQIDARPMQGQWPTSRWQAGDRLADRYTLDLSSALPASDYTLWVGLYDPNTGERLPVTTTENLTMDNAVQLTAVSVP